MAIFSTYAWHAWLYSLIVFAHNSNTPIFLYLYIYTLFHSNPLFMAWTYSQFPNQLHFFTIVSFCGNLCHLKFCRYSSVWYIFCESNPFSTHSPIKPICACCSCDWSTCLIASILSVSWSSNFPSYNIQARWYSLCFPYASSRLQHIVAQERGALSLYTFFLVYRLYNNVSFYYNQGSFWTAWSHKLMKDPGDWYYMIDFINYPNVHKPCPCQK